LIARRHKAQLERSLAELLERSGVRHAGELARAIWLLSEGAISLILVHGDRGYSVAAAKAARTLVRCHRSEYGSDGQSRAHIASPAMPEKTDDPGPATRGHAMLPPGNPSTNGAGRTL
jgi:hypothetical protein